MRGTSADPAPPCSPRSGGTRTGAGPLNPTTNLRSCEQSFDTGAGGVQQPVVDVEASSKRRCPGSRAATGGPRVARRGTPAATARRGAAGASRSSAGRSSTRRSRRSVPYAELHCHSNFSFLDGASHPEELATEAARLGLEALALTDHDGFYGVVRFAEAARAVGLPTVFGAEITLTPGLAADRSVVAIDEADTLDPGRHRPGARQPRPRSARRPPAAARRRARRATPGWPARSASATSRGRRGRRSSRSADVARNTAGDVVGAHRLPQGRGAAGAGGRRPGGGPARAAAADRGVRARPGARRAVGSRRPARLGPQRRPRRAGRPPRRRRASPRTTSTTPRRPSAAWPPRSPPCGPAAASTSSTRGCRRRPAPTSARAPSSAAASPATPAWSSWPPRSAGPPRSTCRSSPRRCRRSRARDGLTEMAVPPPRRRGGRPAPLRRAAAALRRPVAAGPGVADDRPRAGDHRAARLRRLLPRRVGPRRVLPARRTSSARAGGAPPTRRSATRSASPTPTPCRSACCSSASCRPSATARRTSTSTSRATGGRRSSSTCTASTAGTTPRRSPTSSRTGPRSAVRDMAKALGYAPGQQDAWSKQVDGWGNVAATAKPARRTASPQPVLDLARAGRGRPAPPRHPLRRDGHLRPAGDRGVPGRVGADGQALGAAVGQGRLRRGRAGEVRPARPRDAVGAALRRRPDPRAPRLRGRPGHHPAGGRGLRHALPGRHGRRVPDRVAGPDGHAAPAAAADVLRPRGRGGADPARPDPGRVGAPVHPPPQRPGAGHVPPPAARELPAARRSACRCSRSS